MSYRTSDFNLFFDVIDILLTLSRVVINFFCQNRMYCTIYRARMSNAALHKAMEKPDEAERGIPFGADKDRPVRDLDVRARQTRDAVGKDDHRFREERRKGVEMRGQRL